MPDGHWEIRGEKIRIGNAAWSGLIVAFARAEDEGGEPLGVTAFLIPTDLPGVRNAEEAPTMGMRNMVQNRLCFDRVQVPMSHVLGKVGQGMAIAQETMLRGRLGIAAMSLGAMRRALQIMVAYASSRTIATGRLIEHPIAAQRIFDCACCVRAIDALVGRTAAELDGGRGLPDEVLALNKLAATELLGEVADHLMQITGGRGYVETSGVPQLFRDARLLRIFEGPSETLTSFVGTRLLQDHAPVRDMLERAFHGPAGARHLERALDELRELVDATPLDARLRGLAASQAGRVAGWCVLESAIEGVRAAGDRLDALTWVRSKAELEMDKLRRLPDVAWRCPADLLAAEAERCAMAVGLPATPAANVETVSLLQSLFPAGPLDAARRTSTSRHTPAVAATPPGPASTEADRVAIQERLIALVARRARADEEAIDVHAAFADFGLDSADALSLADHLGDWLGRPVEPTLVWDHPSIAALSRHLAMELARGDAHLSEHPDAPSTHGATTTAPVRSLSAVTRT